MDISQSDHSTGPKALFVNWPGATAGSVQMWFRAGSALETGDDKGVAHFLEHMFFKGSHKRPKSQIADEVESFGGDINAFTSFDYTCYYINTPVTYLEKSVDILMDMVSNPTFKQEELVPERDVVFEEYRRSLDSPHQFNFKFIQKNCFLGAYAHPILGEEKTIKNFSRQQIMEFRKNHYNLQNALLIIAGDIKDKQKYQKIISSYTMPDGPKTKFPAFKIKPRDSLHLYNYDVRMATLSLVIKAPSFEDQAAPLEDLALNCLGHGESSRLYQKLVIDSSLGNAVSTSTMFFAHGGCHFIKIQCPSKNLKKIYTTFIDTLKELNQRPFDESEIVKIKNQYASSKIYERETLESFAFSLGHGFAQNEDIHCDEKFIQKIKNAPTKDIHFILGDLLDRPIVATLQLPQADQTQLFEADLKKFIKSLHQAIKKRRPKKTASAKITASKFDPQAKKIVFKNGLKLVYRQNTMTPTFVLQAYLKGGLALENKITNGYHHLLGNMLTKGYDGLDYTKLKLDLEKKSTSLNGFSGKNAYGLTMHGMCEHEGNLFKHFFKSLLTPSFKPKYFKIEKELLKRALENDKEDAVRQCFKKFNQVIFNNHPYSMPVAGSLDGLKTKTIEEVRKIHAKNLKANPITIVYSGETPLEKIMEQIEHWGQNLKFTAKKAKKAQAIHKIYGKKEHITFNKQQVQIFLGLPGYKMTDTFDIYLKILTQYLSGQASELFVEVRDRQGLCYAVQPIHFSGLDGGYWGIYIGAGHDKKQAAIKAINSILAKLQNKGLSKAEFDKVKKMIHGQSLINIQTNEDYANIYSVSVLHDLSLDHYHLTNQTIEKCSREAFNSFLKKFLGKKANIITAGPNE